jgi:GTP-dependent phosphoenolpyruvate carboxykinase
MKRSQYFKDVIRRTGVSGKCACAFVFCYLVFGLISGGNAEETTNRTNAVDLRNTIFTNVSTKLSTTYDVGWWIWTDQMLDQQTCRF